MAMVRLRPEIPLVRNNDMGRTFELDTSVTTGPLRYPPSHPGLLAGETKPMVAAWPATPEFYGIELLWKCARFFTADGNSGPSLPANNPTADALSLAELLKNKTIESTCYMKRDLELRTSLQLPDNFKKLTPMAKTDALQKSGASLRLRDEFMENGSKLTILRAVQGSLLSVSVGINNYLRFCTMADSKSPPP